MAWDVLTTMMAGLAESALELAECINGWLALVQSAKVFGSVCWEAAMSCKCDGQSCGQSCCGNWERDGGWGARS